MSALIKNGDIEGLMRVALVASLKGAQPNPTPAIAPSEDQLRIRDLEDALSALRTEHAAILRQHAIEIERIRQSAREEGLAAGRAEEAALLAALSHAAQTARASASEALIEASAMALGMARSALCNILGDNAQWPAMIEEILARRCSQIDAALVLRIRVSAFDFPEPEALSRLSEANIAAIDVVVDPKLPSGSCLFELSLGEMEVGPVMQGRKLLDFFDNLAARGE